MAKPLISASRLKSLIGEMRDNWGILGVPTNFQFSSDSKKLYFLATTNDKGASIHYVQVTDDDSPSQIEWVPLLGSGEVAPGDEKEVLSKEEALRRERMRASHGLHTFSLQQSTGLILVPASPTWFIYNTNKSPDSSSAITELKTSKPGSRIDPKLCPNGAFVSFIRDNDLWIQSVSTLEETRLTYSYDNSVIQTVSAGFKASGIAEYCMQEEFDRYTGYWWSPSIEGTLHRILYVNTDESHVTTYNIGAPGIRGEVDKYVYPLAGDENAHFSLSIAEINVSSDGASLSSFATNNDPNANANPNNQTPGVKLKHLSPSLKTRFPWCEYIPRLGWCPSGKKIWVQMLDRQQQHSVMIAIDIDQFKDVAEPDEGPLVWANQKSELSNKMPVVWDPSSPLMSGVTMLHSEVTKLWVNVTDICHWFSDGSDRVIIASEICASKNAQESQSKDSSSSQSTATSPSSTQNDSPIKDSSSDTTASASGGSKRATKNGFNKMRHLYLLTPETKYSYSRKALTEGEHWQVETNMLVVDEKRELMYFMGTKDSPLECHLYVSSTTGLIEPSKNAQRLTPAGCYHSVGISPDCNAFVSCYSNTKEPHRVQIFRIQHKTEKSGSSQQIPAPSPSSNLPPSLPTSGLSCTLARTLTPPTVSFEIEPPELFNFKNSHGETLYGCYYKPRNFDPSRKYPTILKVYGGPHVQYVSNDYKMTRLHLNLQLYAHLGFLVVMIDGVGSWRRGLRFEGYLKNSMGTVEVQEQVDGLTHLIKSGIVDPERIAVTGWSYGGYMALLCLAQRPDFFKVAISGAPVTQWETYDTAYTERYMDTPVNNPSGYEKGSVLHYVSNLPKTPNRLLLIHGLLDENVHVCNTFELIQCLIDHGKPYQLQVFPNERHGVRQHESAKYQELTCLRFFLEHL